VDGLSGRGLSGWTQWTGSQCMDLDGRGLSGWTQWTGSQWMDSVDGVSVDGLSGWTGSVFAGTGVCIEE
jgi:hypothetical protein